MNTLAKHERNDTRARSGIQNAAFAAGNGGGGTKQDGIGTNLEGGTLVLYGKLFKAEHPGLRLNEAAVLHVKGTVADGGKLGVVGDDDYRLAEVFA